MDRRTLGMVMAGDVLTGPFVARPDNATPGTVFWVTPTLTATCASGASFPIRTEYAPGLGWVANPTVIYRSAAIVLITGTLQRSVLRANVTATGTRGSAVLAGRILGTGIIASSAKALLFNIGHVTYAATGAANTFTWRLKHGTATIVSVVTVPGTVVVESEILMRLMPRTAGGALYGSIHQVREASTVSGNAADSAALMSTATTTVDVTVQQSAAGSTTQVRHVYVSWLP